VRVSQLPSAVLKKYDNDFRDFKHYLSFLKQHISFDSRMHILDVGGGNGSFLDLLLDNLPNSTGILLDNSKYMISLNKTHPRKETVLSSATNAANKFGNMKFDIITINLLLHHLVVSKEKDIESIVIRCLEGVGNLLCKKGSVVLYEQTYDGWSKRLDPGRAIFFLSSIKQPMIADFFRRLGANSAGVGVRFRSRAGWREISKKSGYRMVAEKTLFVDNVSLFRRFALGIKTMASHVYLLKRETSS
jgi:ubiquinone/menaquinone biosynthesis C-methylase UbiE